MVTSMYVIPVMSNYGFNAAMIFMPVMAWTTLMLMMLMVVIITVFHDVNDGLSDCAVMYCAW
jgi:hypothetical protein